MKEIEWVENTEVEIFYKQHTIISSKTNRNAKLQRSYGVLSNTIESFVAIRNNILRLSADGADAFGR